MKEAMTDQIWFQVVKDEYDVLMKNNAWTLVPNTSPHRIIDNK